MISIELLGEVLGKYCWDVELFNTDVVYTTDTPVNSLAKELNISNDYRLSINIHELAHKCKEWAFKNNRVLLTCLTNDVEGVIAYCRIDNLNKNNPDNLIDYYADTEPEAIFKACQWILDNKEK